MREDEHWVTARVVDGMGLDEDAPPQVRGLIPMPRRRADHAGSRQQRTSRGWPKPKPFLKKNWGRRMYRVKTPLYSVLQWKVVQKRGLICQNPGSYAKRTSYAQILGHMPKSWVTCQTSKTHTSEDFSRSSLLGTTLKPKFTVHKQHQTPVLPSMRHRSSVTFLRWLLNGPMFLANRTFTKTTSNWPTDLEGY